MRLQQTGGLWPLVHSPIHAFATASHRPTAIPSRGGVSKRLLALREKRASRRQAQTLALDEKRASVARLLLPQPGGFEGVFLGIAREYLRSDPGPKKSRTGASVFV